MTGRTRIKICGITQPHQAVSIAAMGVDAVGLVFVAKSKRNLSLAAAIEIRAAIPPFVQAVALFLDAEHAAVEQVIDRVAPDLLQFHGRESVLDCERWNRPYIKAVAMGSRPDLRHVARTYGKASGFLLDGHRHGELGGQGSAFDWATAPQVLDRPLILAGGLSSDNVAQAIRTVRPFAVDVSSGVESSPGLKDLSLVREFVSEVSRATTEN